MKVHELKILPGPFSKYIQGLKTHEVRNDDRNFQIGDVLILREWEEKYMPCVPVVRVITDKTCGGNFGLPEGLCCLSVREPR